MLNSGSRPPAAFLVEGGVAISLALTIDPPDRFLSWASSNASILANEDGGN